MALFEVALPVGVPVHVRFPSFCGEVLCGRRAEVYGPCMRRL